MYTSPRGQNSWYTLVKTLPSRTVINLLRTMEILKELENVSKDCLRNIPINTAQGPILLYYILWAYSHKANETWVCLAANVQLYMYAILLTTKSRRMPPFSCKLMLLNKSKRLSFAVKLSSCLLAVHVPDGSMLKTMVRESIAVIIDFCN